jgi:hypothetical protein
LANKIYSAVGSLSRDPYTTPLVLYGSSRRRHREPWDQLAGENGWRGLPSDAQELVVAYAPPLSGEVPKPLGFGDALIPVGVDVVKYHLCSGTGGISQGRFEQVGVVDEAIFV